MAAKKDPLKEKEARQKKIAIVGGVLLLGLMAFQVPRTMKMLHGSSATPTTPASTTTASAAPGSSPLAPPSLDGSAASVASGGAGSPGGATSKDGVVDASSPLPASSGQLISFSRFKTKDPFVQQVQDCTGGCAASSSGGAAAATSGATAGSGSGLTSSPAATGNNPAVSTPGGPTSGGTAASTSAKATTASISVNGTLSRVSVGHTFPTATPVFMLVSLTTKEAKISIAGGSIEGGAATVTLKLGKTVKLQNTADGAMYALTLVGAA